MDDNRELFETMPVGKALARMAIPTIISQLITMIYNLADTYFIGRTNNPYMVAAASLSYVLFFILTALSNLFGVGGGSQISRLLGQKRCEEAKKVCTIWGGSLLCFLWEPIFLVWIRKSAVLQRACLLPGRIRPARAGRRAAACASGPGGRQRS